MSHCAPPDQGVTTPPELSAMSRALVAATANDKDFQEVVETYGHLAVVTILKRVLADIGDQEQHRMFGLSDLRDDDSVSDAEYLVAKRNYNLWKRSIAVVRQRLRRRINEIQPFAQMLVDEHQADRRALSVLARRIWLWEEGLEDKLEDALDDWTISGTVGDPTRPRMTLREHVEDIRARNGEVTP